MVKLSLKEELLMENTLSVAKTLYNLYLERFGCSMDQMKMHKLMYFVQRESLMNSEQVLFSDDFFGWKFGPVLLTVRNQYMTGKLFAEVDGNVSDEAKQIVNSVLDRYGVMSSWKLSSLSHNEFSWKCARKGLNASDNGSVKLSLEAMKVDAARERANRKTA